jgi:hypothetical protein
VPGAAVGVDRGVRDLGERAVNRVSLISRSRAVRGRADERMTEANPRAKRGQAGLGRRLRRIDGNSELLSGAPDR